MKFTETLQRRNNAVKHAKREAEESAEAARAAAQAMREAEAAAAAAAEEAAAEFARVERELGATVQAFVSELRKLVAQKPPDNVIGRDMRLAARAWLHHPRPTSSTIVVTTDDLRPIYGDARCEALWAGLERCANVFERVTLELGDAHNATAAVVDIEATVWRAFIARLRTLAGEA